MSRFHTVASGSAVERTGVASEMTGNGAFFNRTLESFDGLKLNVSVWAAKAPKATVFYIHGIQSHSGWLFETGPYLASRGVTVVAMDRRGSGRSEGLRGHSDSAFNILKDYKQGWEYALSFSSGVPFTVLGQSFGGSILAALICRYNLPCDNVIFSAPALGQHRFRNDLYDLVLKRCQKGVEQVQVPLRDLEYSTDEKYLAFIANDLYINRSMTRSMASSLIEIEDIYYDNKLALEMVDAPIHFIEPLADSIINMKAAKDALARYVGITCHSIDSHTHYMEFSNKRKDLWQTIESISKGSERP